ncbi:MAG: hypothetical protein ACTSQG_01160, partial [Promethearchaeota archaeon]
WSLKITVILFIIFLFFPYLLIYFKKLGEKAIIKYNQQRFKNRFLEEIKDGREVNIFNLSSKYDVNLIYVKNYLRDQISQGLLQGELKDDIFYIKEGFKIMDVKERRIKFMQENIGKFISPHRSIKIKDISSNFKVPKNIVMAYLKKLIDQGVIRGFFEGDTFFRDLSLHLEKINCPYCAKEIDLRDL